MKKKSQAEAPKGFNGWANRPTWNLALWALNDEGLYISMTEAFCGERRISPQAARVWAEARFPLGSTPDGDALAEVNWKEIAKMIEEAVNE